MNNLSPSEQWKMIKPIWRILLMVLIIQIVGGTSAATDDIYGHVVVDFWFGGAVSTFPGFLLGLIWQKISVKNFQKDFGVILFVGLISLILSIAAFVMPLEIFAAELNR